VCSHNHDFECLSGSVCACLPGHIRCVEKKKIRRGGDRQGICFCLLESHLEKIQRKHPSFLFLFLFSLSRQNFALVEVKPPLAPVLALLSSGCSSCPLVFTCHWPSHVRGLSGSFCIIYQAVAAGCQRLS